ncbi:MAG: hypothetical protein V4547_12540 [Bacteroidota bacterium]
MSVKTIINSANNIVHEQVVFLNSIHSGPFSQKGRSIKKSGKIVFSFFITCFFVLVSCHSKQKNIVSTLHIEQTAVTPKTIGKVSHEYRSTGCSTVIIIADDINSTILIPKNKLAENIDVDGLEITFYYRKLRMPQPVGCTKGIPAELTDITKK